MRLTPFRLDNKQDLLATPVDGSTEALLGALGISPELTTKLTLEVTTHKVCATVLRLRPVPVPDEPTHDVEIYAITSEVDNLAYAAQFAVFSLLGIPKTWPVVRLELVAQDDCITCPKIELEMHTTDTPVDPTTAHTGSPLIARKLH